MDLLFNDCSIEVKASEKDGEEHPAAVGPDKP